MGCFAQRDPDHIRDKAGFVDVICGPGRLAELTSFITNGEVPSRTIVLVDDFRSTDTCNSRETFDLSRQIHPPQSQAFVRVQRGCNKFCSYCVVPYVRGAECSRPLENIITEAIRLDQAGCKQLTLLGQTVSSYRSVHRGRSVGLADLLYEMHETTSIPRIRFVTSYPAGFPSDILEAMAELDRVCPYLHIPAQHGSDRMLKLMNRKYTSRQYLDLVHQARQLVPKIAIVGDFISGFPTETDSDHRASVELLSATRYKNCFLFKYSPRPGTAAAKRYPDDVPDELKTSRLEELLQLQNDIACEDNGELLGHTVTVLVEGRSKKNTTAAKISQLVGRTTDDRIVVFDGPAELIGQIVDVQINRTSAVTLFATFPCVVPNATIDYDGDS